MTDPQTWVAPTTVFSNSVAERDSSLPVKALDTDWSRGSGDSVRAESGQLVALLSGRTLPDGRALRHLKR
jgi:hypothetical protein